MTLPTYTFPAYNKCYQGDPKAFGRVAVLYGGLSAEREISLQSGTEVLDALLDAGVNAFGIDVGKDIVARLENEHIDFVFIALHGPGGEDGKVQAMLEFLNIPYTGSGHAASALAMNKLNSKKIWQATDLLTPEYQVLNANSDWQSVYEKIGPDIFVKPAHEGSSIGMSLVDTFEKLEAAFAYAAEYDSLVIAERKITGAEYTQAILNGQVLPVVSMTTRRDFYDFQAKYEDEDTAYTCPCELNEADQKTINHLTQSAFSMLGCRGWGRVDYIREQTTGRFYLLEVNTIPGMTSHSLVPKAAKVAGLEFVELVLEILVGAKS